MITSLYIMLTCECNCTCEYCYLKKNPTRPNRELHKRAATSFTNFIQGSPGKIAGRPQIRFIGGEPWLKAKTLISITKEFLSKIEHGLVVVNSNGTLVKEEDLLVFHGDERLVHVISLDGPKEVHDSRRKLKEGSGFERACAGIRLLQQAGLKVVPNCVLDRQTLETLPVFMDFLAQDLSINQLSLSLRFDDKHPMTLAEKYDALELAYKLADNRSIHLGGHHRLHLGNRIPQLRCRAGTDTIMINPDGTTNACQRFVGRKPDDPVWDDSFDWNGFESTQDCSGICGSEQDHALGNKLVHLYQNSYPVYSKISDLDRLLFGVIQ